MTGVELLPPERAHRDNPEWHEIRRQGVTASEIAVILGLSRWDSPWSLWHRKRGLIGEGPDSDDADWGRRLEPAIADAAADRLDPHENLRFLPAGLYRHDKRHWQMATPDRLVYRDECVCGAVEELDVVCSCMPHEGELLAVLEVKHPYSWDGWGDDGTEDIPADYMAQALWQCDVMGAAECWVAAYSRHEMRCYIIRADAEGADADLAMMRQRAVEFLASADPPPLDSHPATLRAVKQLHPDVEDREQEVMHEVARGYRLACLDLDKAKARKRETESALRLAMGNARRAIVLDPGGYELVATRSVFTRRNLDSKAIRAEDPDLADKHTTTSTVDTLRPARKDTTE